MIYGCDNSVLMEGVSADADFRDFIVGMDQLDEVRDATFFVRNDGLLAFSEGYCHPPGAMIGNIVYVPDGKGTKTIFGTRYASIIKRYGEEDDEWIPFQEQIGIYRRIDPGLHVDKPLYAENKCRFNTGDFIGWAPPRRSLLKVRERLPYADKSILEISEAFDIDPASIGCTGSISLGNLKNIHDFDLIFYGTTRSNRRIVDRIYEITKDPSRQVIEMGMKWAIRFYDDNGNVICPFFCYSEKDEIPLADFTMEVEKEACRYTGRVCDDLHNSYMPSILQLEEVESADSPSFKEIMLIIYHGGSKGEYRCGDRLGIRGKLVRVETGGKQLQAILVTDMGDTWKL
ncbi:MAG: hypothetical protein P9M00_09260 [Candidatus Tritonobacter lacicola]|nr:hypothetical protein [Candidatus Tritonobacter lacicola]